MCADGWYYSGKLTELRKIFSHIRRYVDKERTRNHLCKILWCCSSV